MKDLAARCLMAGVPGTSLTGELRALLQGGLGGVMLFERNVSSAQQLCSLTDSVRADGPGVLIATDAEGGVNTNHLAAAGLPQGEGNRSLGLRDDPGYTRQVARTLGTSVAGLGLNVVFGPCADLGSRPDNPIVGARSFGADPELVARHTLAYAEGLREAGVIACAKHFPGHGGTAEDSHLELPAASLSDDDLAPFRAAARAGIPMIMTAHVRYTGYGDAPATLNPLLVTRLLREEIGFAGVVVTDALEMRAISDAFTPAEAAVAALAAGVDLVLIGDRAVDIAQVRDAIVTAVAEGRLAQGRVEEAASRILSLAP
ncbi:glycoside hydrolase family 3 N-terminal domain-containing protein [Nonomuraea typhae]|uniref:Glycoside hydrolase family 3 N-terminal domain-containing protein n=1 Tax=Nonomuraea typhae TaxID=2603600 RepID=A0ABW7Z3A7_9ACTN